MQWSEVVAHPDLQRLPFKIELNQFGSIEMSPASVAHARIQAAVTLLLDKIKDGCVMTEPPVHTILGVRVPDAAWASNQFMTQQGDNSPLLNAPEICVEVLSEGNSQTEMGAKTSAYLSAGAKEVWLVQLSKRIDVYSAGGKQQKSAYFRRMPTLR